ncbi:MAG TPA: hypothetical protein VH416_05745 [Gaiellaceae bacterium]
MSTSREGERLADPGPWRRWGPYLSERQWSTVREDYSPDGEAWDHFPHEHARSRAYRWGEDGLAGLSDERQLLCFALALWNGRDPILKERAFGLTNSEGNHGEDVKEYYFFLDATPTHSWLRWLYKYPQDAFPYAELVEENRRRSQHDFEYELFDTGVFDESRYFDVEVEYAKAGPDDILATIRATNRGPEPAPLHLLPTLWFRNTWSDGSEGARPLLSRTASRPPAIRAEHPELGVLHLYVDGDARLLFTENETNSERLWGSPNVTPHVKDAFHEAVVNGRDEAVNADGTGTKTAAHLQAVLEPGQTWTVRLRLASEELRDPFGEEFEAVRAARREEADEFYAAALPERLSDDARLVARQALAGMLWSKQFYSYDVGVWLREHGRNAFSGGNQRNGGWYRMQNEAVISMPDTWEYPWYAAWDLAFHCITLALVDPAFAKDQLELMLRDGYLHPNGQLPAYEWDFSDVNPPVHAWAALYVFRVDAAATGRRDVEFLQGLFHRLLLNFTWWVNRKDSEGNNLFEGGFLGLDNIGVFDRSKPLPTGGHLEQADGTAWMALFSQCMLTISLELAREDESYEAFALKFAEHFLWIRAAMDAAGPESMWSEEDGFFYDMLRFPDGRAEPLRIRSTVGLLPLAAVTVFDPETLGRFPHVLEEVVRLIQKHPELAATSPGAVGVGGRRMLSVLYGDDVKRVLRYLLDEDEFLSPYGIRSLSRHHRDSPYVFHADGAEYRVDYEPAESTTRMFGGNSNWRGPVWFPTNILVIRALLQLYEFYGDDFKVECPTGSGNEVTLFEAAHEIAQRLGGIFLRDEDGRRPVFGGNETFQTDPHWRDHLLFYEYFHGDNGAGLGASHQTGWTGLVALLLHGLGRLEASDILAKGWAALVPSPAEPAGAGRRT